MIAVPFLYEFRTKFFGLGLTISLPFAIISSVDKNSIFAGMAELADAHGSGPCESNFMQVQVLLPAPESR